MALTLDENGRLVDTIGRNSDLDYQLDLADWLADIGDTLDTLTVTSTNCTVHDSGIVGTKVRAWITPASTGRNATLTFRFATANVPPRIEELTIFLTIVPHKTS